MSWKKEVGQQIREARERVGLNQDELGKAVGRVRQTIVNYEAGSVTLPPDILGKIAIRLAMTEIKLNGYRFSIYSEPPPAPQTGDQLKLDFDREHVFPNATIKISPTRISITITAMAPLETSRSAA